jgi:Fe2+ or Zn2+ uptake regulation protein
MDAASRDAISSPFLDREPGCGGTTAYRDVVRVDVHEQVADRLKAAGQRYTSARRALVDRLRDAGQPMTLPELLDGAALAQSSAYRNLALLEQAGAVHRIVTSADHACYELAEDLTEHHHHLICTSCGQVEDFTVSPVVERILHDAVSDVREGTGFTAAHHRLDLIGTCRSCRQTIGHG